MSEQHGSAQLDADRVDALRARLFAEEFGDDVERLANVFADYNRRAWRNFDGGESYSSKAPGIQQVILEPVHYLKDDQVERIDALLERFNKHSKRILGFEVDAGVDRSWISILCEACDGSALDVVPHVVRLVSEAIGAPFDFHMFLHADMAGINQDDYRPYPDYWSNEKLGPLPAPEAPR
jgi:hypothetical protein